MNGSVCYLLLPVTPSPTLSLGRVLFKFRSVTPLPVLALLLWLHFAPGMAGPNRFGPAPDRLGFARHEVRRREAPMGGVEAAM